MMVKGGPSVNPSGLSRMMTEVRRTAGYHASEALDYAIAVMRGYREDVVDGQSVRTPVKSNPVRLAAAKMVLMLAGADFSPIHGEAILSLPPKPATPEELRSILRVADGSDPATRLLGRSEEP